MPLVNKHLDPRAKRTAIEPWRAKVAQRNIMKHLEMSKTILMRVLAFARANPANQLAQRKKDA